MHNCNFMIKNQCTYSNIAPVLLIFFNRPNTLKKVFEMVKNAKPSVLLLYQDGPRDAKPDDKIKIEHCRRIVEDVDWPCKIYKYYQDKNVGCDPSEYLAQKWAFSIVDKCIVLEDDDVPSLSFFDFMTEMLIKYENEDRISIISGMNHFEVSNIKEDYLFTKNCSIWGWASWKRVIDAWDTNYSELLELGEKQFTKKYKSVYPMKILVKAIKNHIKSGKHHYETILIYNSIVNNQLTIVPAKNLILNIGNCPEGGTHSSTSIKRLPRAIQKLFLMKTYDFDLQNYQKEIIEDTKYSKRVYALMGWSSPLVRLSRKIEVGIKSLWIK